MGIWVKCGNGKIELAPYKGAVRGYEVVGCDRMCVSLIIPDNYRGKPVVSIDSDAFMDCPVLAEVFIPDSVKYVYEGAFNYLPAFERVRVPLGIQKTTVNRLFPGRELVVFYGTAGLAEEDIPDDGGKMLVDDDYTEAVALTDNSITILPRKPEKVKFRETKAHFRLMQALKCVAYFLPTLIAAIIPFDIFNSKTGHYLNIVAEGSIGLGWTIALYVIYCITALLVGICFTSDMFLKEKYVTLSIRQNTKQHDLSAKIIGALALFIICINLAYIVPNIGKDKLTMAGGDVNVIEYVKSDEAITLPVPEKSNDVYDDYYTRYTFLHWNIGGAEYPAGAEYNPEGWERAEAVFDIADYATLYISTDSAAIRVDYGGMTDKMSSGEIEIELGTEVTLTATFTYNNVKEMYVDSKEVSNPYIFTMERHTSAYAKSISDGCFVEGTLVTLADGSVKAVEDLAVGDELLVFNHITGKLDTAPLFINAHAMQAAEEYDVITLTFSGGESISIVDEHAIYDLSENRYAYINENNAKDYIGHAFAGVSPGALTETTLLSVDVERRATRIYNPVSDVYVNLVAGGLLTNSACTIDMFLYDEDMKYNEEAMKSDIALYGLYGYEVFRDYIPIEAYNSFPLAYYKVAVGKGLCTFSDVLVLIRHYLNDTTVK